MAGNLLGRKEARAGEAISGQKTPLQALLMSYRPSTAFEVEIEDLRAELDDLRGEVIRLKREIRELRRAVAASSELGGGDRSDSREVSYSDSRAPSQRSPHFSPQQSPVPDRAPSVAETNGPTTPSNPGTPLTWIEREEICDEIGRFIARSLEGTHRGSSGRDKLPFSSRIWLVARDFEGQIYTPVRVFRTWTSAKRLVKPNNLDPGDSVFVGLPSEREAKRVVHSARLHWPTIVEQ